MCKTAQQELQELATKQEEQITELDEQQKKRLVSVVCAWMCARACECARACLCVYVVCVYVGA